MRLADGGTAVPGRNPGPHAEVAEPPNHDRRGRGCCAEILKAERGRQRALGQGHAGAAGQAGPAGGPHVRPRATDGSSASVSSRPPATRLCEPGGDTADGGRRAERRGDSLPCFRGRGRTLVAGDRGHASGAADLPRQTGKTCRPACRRPRRPGTRQTPRRRPSGPATPGRPPRTCPGPSQAFPVSG